jgi:streptogramin lyase
MIACVVLGCGRAERVPVGPATPGRAAPAGPTVGGELLVASFEGDAVFRFAARDGAFLGTFAATPELDGALGMDLGPDGRVYVAGEESNRVLRFDPRTGAFVGRFVWDDPDTPVDETGGLQGPGAVLFGPDGRLYVSSFDGDAVLRYDGRTGEFVDEFVAPRAGGLDGPDAGMAFGPGGDLFVPGFYSHAVHRYDGVTGEFVERFTPADGSLLAPRTLVFRGEHLLVTCERRGEVVRFDARTGAYVDAPVREVPGAAGMAALPDGALVVVSIDAAALVRVPAGGEGELLVPPRSGGLRAPTHLLWWPG